MLENGNSVITLRTGGSDIDLVPKVIQRYMLCALCCNMKRMFWVIFVWLVF